MVNTFLPFASFVESARCLDRLRLNKQILECDQILNTLRKEREGFQGRIGWINHPATRMWKGYEPCLSLYRDCMLDEWLARGYKSKRHYLNPKSVDIRYPPWFGRADFHISHQSNLLRKDRAHYSKWFTGRDDLPYVWPV